MNKRNLFINIFMLFLASGTMAQTRLVEKIKPVKGNLVIPYEKYVLPNGLTLIIHEDHSDPIVHLDVTYHVGSAREEIGKSGFAHFFEHMMFQGSENVADEQHFKIVSEAGGTLNGTTNKDRTNYFETLPKNQLEVALWLEADRMGFLLDAVTKEKFEIQRATVKNERGQNYDNKPYGLVGETISKYLYPYGHPYSWLTIGYVEDLDRVDVNDLKKFFLRWYGPNNAVVTVGGDVNPKDVKALVEKYFGSIPRGPEVNKQVLQLPVLASDKYITMEDNIRFPLLQAVFPTVPTWHKDEAALDLLSSVLGDGKNSIIYKNFIKSGIATEANVYQPTYELAGEFTFAIKAFPGTPLSKIDSLFRATLKEFETRGISADDLARAKAGMEMSLIRGLESVRGKVSQLASFETFTGNPDKIQDVLNRYNKVTVEDLMRVYNEYIKGKNAVFLSAVPKGQKSLQAREPNGVMPSSAGYTPVEDNTKLSYQKPVDNFDRSKKPAPGKTPAVTLPSIYRTSFENGLKITGTQNSETPMVTLHISIKGGHLLDPQGKSGLAVLVARLMNESSEKRSAEEITNELEKLGSSIHFGAGDESTNISVTSLRKNLDATLRILEEKLFSPAFLNEDFERLKKQQLEQIANQATQAVSIANKVFAKVLYGENNPRAIHEWGTTESVNFISLSDVKDFYHDNYAPNVSNVVVAGDVTQQEITAKLNFLKFWKKMDVHFPKEAPVSNIEKTKIYLVHKDNAPQSEIRIGYVALPYDATGEFYKARIMNHTLGGTFNSRINLNLREKKGYTYGARSAFQGTEYPGYFIANAGVIAKSTDSSVYEFMYELENYKNGVSEEELSFTKNALAQSEALKYETIGQKASFIKQIVEYNLNKDFTKEQYKILQKLTTSDIKKLAQKYLVTDKMAIVVVGDKNLVKKGLSGLGFEIVELDKQGNTVQ